MAWTDERVATLTRLWAEGFTASQVAARLGGTTRNAVISKVHRLGMSGRATPHRNGRRKSKKTRHPMKPRFANSGNPALRALYLKPEPFTAEPEILIPENERKRLIDLEDQDCRWGIGDPQLPDFHFCGRRQVPGLPYCEAHSKRAYAIPTQVRRSPASAAATPTKESVDA